MEQIRVGFAFCGSFCTYGQAMSALEQVKARFGDVTPIVSEASAALDTRFGAAHDHMREMERICDRRVIDSIPKAEPIGPKHLLDVLLVCPCTGNTMAKLACLGHRHHGDHGGKGPSAQRRAAGAGHFHQRRPGGQRQTYRRADGQKERLFRPLPAG